MGKRQNTLKYTVKMGLDIRGFLFCEKHERVSKIAIVRKPLVLNLQKKRVNYGG